MSFNFLDPLTRKRLRRFRQKKRAYYSLWALLILFGISLIANLLCNDNPLLVRYQGQFYFPIFRYYPESAFVPGGHASRPDYKKIAQSEHFRSPPGNYMIFPPIPYGPNSNLDPQDLANYRQIRITLTPAVAVGAINIDQQLNIKSATAMGEFFGSNKTSYIGQSLTNYWPVPAPLTAALAERFANQPAPGLNFTATINNLPTTVSLIAYKPRQQPPENIRLTFRQTVTNDTANIAITCSTNCQTIISSNKGWRQLPSTTQTEILQTAQEANLTSTTSMMVIDGQKYRFRTEFEDIHWPYPPVKGHWLGIDDSGRDVLARILYGLRIALIFSFLLVFSSFLIGIIIGGWQGYHGGKIDIMGQRFIEIWNALPFLYVMILIGSLYGRSFLLLLICYALFHWISISYYIRAEFLRLRHLPFVDAARSLGIGSSKIMFRHILPNALVPVLTFFPFYLVGAIGALTSLDYLGFGLPPPTPSWGELLYQAQENRWAWWLTLYPSLALFTVMILGVFIGEGLRDAYDPKHYPRLE